jgi:hypothetical protein
MRRALVLVVLGGLLLAGPASAGVKPVTLGGNFTLGFPLNEFKDNVDETGIGGTGYATIALPGSPFHLGGSIGYLSQGSAKVSADVPIPGDLSLPVDVVTRNNVLLGHLLLRLQHTDATFRPYIDGLFGFGRYWTTTEVTVLEQTETNTDRDLDTWTVNYGLGGGLMFEVYRTSMSAGDGGFATDAAVCVDLGVRYLVGGKADYAKTNTVDEDGNFDTTSSRTDMVTVHIGVAFQFF